jgi:hypothetical protein
MVMLAVGGRRGGRDDQREDRAAEGGARTY